MEYFFDPEPKVINKSGLLFDVFLLEHNSRHSTQRKTMKLKRIRTKMQNFRKREMYELHRMNQQDLLDVYTCLIYRMFCCPCNQGYI